MPKKQKSVGRKAPNKPPTRPATVPWYQRAWIVLSFLGAVLYGVLAHGPTLLTNVENLPGKFRHVSGQFLSWYYEDQDWEGLWSASPEGYADEEDMNLSDVDIKLHLTMEHGRVGGEIATKSICRTAPMFDYFLLDGKVSGDTATVTAFDFIGGKRKNFFRFTAQREGIVLTIALKEGSPEWLPSTARIALHPGKNDPYKSLMGTCSVERESLLKQNRPKDLGWRSLRN